MLLEVGAGDLREEKVRVAQGPDQLAHRAGDLTGVENRRGDLVEERREQVVVVAVDEQHVDRRPFQRSRAGATAEAGARDRGVTLRGACGTVLGRLAAGWPSSPGRPRHRWLRPATWAAFASSWPPARRGRPAWPRA